MDQVDKKQWEPTASTNLVQAMMYMREVDRYNDLHVSCMQTPSNAKFLMLHENIKQEEQIKSFFNEVYELFVKIVMNPFYDPSERLNIPQFDDKVRRIAARTF